MDELKAVASAEEIRELTVTAGLQGLDMDDTDTVMLTPLAFSLAHSDWVERQNGDQSDVEYQSDDSLSEMRERWPALFRLSFEK